MNRHLILVIFTFMFLLCISPLNSTVFAKSPAKTILEYHHDVTGDGEPEKITLFGIPFKNSPHYYRKVWAEIATQGQKQVKKINYKGGFAPRLEFADLNHDGIDDILFSSVANGNGVPDNFSLHTTLNSKLQEIPLPAPLQIEGSFSSNFKAVIHIQGIERPVFQYLIDRKATYISAGLYQESGILNEPAELIIDPIPFFEIVEINNKGGFGLKSYRQISGAHHTDGLGTVEALWYYENGQWHPIDVQWKTG